MRTKLLTTALVILFVLGVFSSGAMAASTDGKAKGNSSGDTIVWAKPSGKTMINNFIQLMSSSSYYIYQGQTNHHQKTLSGYCTSMEIILNWADTTDSLRLTITSPTGENLGTCYDNDDGVHDGRIRAYISNPAGVTQGTWKLDVYGSYVLGIQSYTI